MPLFCMFLSTSSRSFSCFLIEQFSNEFLNMELYLKRKRKKLCRMKGIVEENFSSLFKLNIFISITLQ